jgi:hypothetical protein
MVRGGMAAETVSVISTTELLQSFGFLVEPLLLFAAYAALDVSRLRCLSKQGLVEREAASGVFYFCSVVFLHLILLSIKDAIPAQGIFNIFWYAGVSGLIVLTALVFRKATQVTLQLSSLVARTEVLETNRQNLSERLNTILRTLSELRMEFSHSIQSANDRLASAENRLRGLEGSYQNIVAGYKGLTDKYQNDIAINNERQERYESLIQKLREQSQILLAQIEETGRLQKEYKEKIEQTPERPEKSASSGNEQRQAVKLTREDGITNREKGNNAQVKTAEYLKGLGFLLENDCDKSAPDFQLFNDGIMVGIGAHKGFTLTKSGTRQRSISRKGIDIEFETAKALHLPLILFVTNLDNGQRWAKMIPYNELEKFKSVSTPVILSENSPEAYQTLQNTINEVRRSLGYQRSG